jgi:acetoin utilization deacetylase AcuC-like enzyme/GNAT superfamily N-acetyltransferase
MVFRIRRVYDDIVAVNRSAIADVQEILHANFSAAPAQDREGIGERLRNPFLKRFLTILHVAENARGNVLGFTLLLHDPDLHFCFLDYIATAERVRGRGGIGAALYERVRDEALALGSQGMFFECLPDEFAACPDESLIDQNRARLRFYERYGARPIIGTAYESPVKPGDTCMPYLVWDDLDRGAAPTVEFARAAVRAILERKYRDFCPPAYVTRVVESFDDPVQIRPPGYVKREPDRPRAAPSPGDTIAMVVNDKHEIHHVRERGYVEAPVRIRVIRKELTDAGLVDEIPVREWPLSHIMAVHDGDLVRYLRRACAAAPEGKSVYPYVFPIRNAARPPRELSVRAGYYCIDTFTPINRNAYPAAKRAVDCALTAADEVLRGRRIAYALVRPPGHHAEHRVFGGFCYFNNAAVAANYLSTHGRVAILDIDYHHGNGQQDIFLQRGDVLTVSIHGHPEFAYPYFSGFEDETGEGDGAGCNINVALPEAVNGEKFRRALKRMIDRIVAWDPSFLVIALGLDPARGDPTGTWTLNAADFEQNGRMLGSITLPTLVVQEGGYRTRTLGVNARRFMTGLLEAAQSRSIPARA